MVLVLGSILSFTTKKEGMIYLAVGEAVALHNSHSLVLLDFKFEQYADGRPKDWISTVQIKNGPKIEVANFPLRVNNPLVVGGITLYQSSFGTVSILNLKDESGKTHILHEGEFLEADAQKALFMKFNPENNSATILLSDASGQNMIEIHTGEMAGKFTVEGISSVETSGIQAVKDHWYPLVLIGFILCGFGICMTFFGKLGEIKS